MTLEPLFSAGPPHAPAPPPAPLVWGAMNALMGSETQTPAALARFISGSLELGVTWFDHANIYGDGMCERVFGQALALLPTEERSAVRLITKCGVRFASPAQPDARVQHYRSDAGYVRAALEGSLKRLGVERVDLFLVHRPDYLMDADDTAQGLAGLVADGLAGAIGVSNFTPAQVTRLNAALGRCPGAPALSAHQLEVSPLATTALDDGRLDQCQDLRLRSLAWSPFAGGKLLNPARDTPAVARTRQALAASVEARPDDTDHIALASLAWLARHPAQIAAVVGTTRLARLEALATGLKAMPAMDPQDWYTILEAARGTRVP